MILEEEVVVAMQAVAHALFADRLVESKVAKESARWVVSLTYFIPFQDV
jgi:hypothetical protein